MDGKMLVRLAAVVFVAFALTATAIEMSREEEPEMPVPAEAEAAGGRSNAVRGELIRCQRLGEAAVGDQACIHAWAENRRRFLGINAQQGVRLPDPSVVRGAEAR